MNNSKVLKDIFNGCIGKETKVNPQKFIYCGCYTTKIGKKFTIDQFIKMSLDYSHLIKELMKKELAKKLKFSLV